MSNYIKINYNNLTDIQIYELLLQGRIHNFPSGFWAGNSIEKAKETAINLLRYLLDEKLKFNKEDIKKLYQRNS